jgi:hypothetical protein
MSYTVRTLHAVAADAVTDLDPRIDPRLMWPLAYLEERLGFTIVQDETTVLHGDIMRVDLARGGRRVRVTWIPETDQRFVSEGTRLLGVYDSFPELAQALDGFAPVRAAA